MIPKGVYIPLRIIVWALYQSTRHMTIPKGVYTPLGIIACPLHWCKGHAIIPKGGLDPPRIHGVGPILV